MNQSPLPASLASRIVYEDNHLLVVNKATSELVQGDKTGDPSLLDHLKALIKERDSKPGQVFLGLVHRLDRPSSGLVIYAKTSKSLSRMSKIFRTRQVQKTYLLITEKKESWKEGFPKMPEGILEDYLIRSEKTNTTRIVTLKPGESARQAKLARLRYQFMEELDRYLLWKVDLETGRQHQIRAQFSWRGLPVRGDLKYRAARSLPGGGIALHAWKLEFTHPVRDERISLSGDPKQVQTDGIWKSIDLS